MSDYVTNNETTNDSITLNFSLRVVMLDDCHIAEMFWKQLNSLVMHLKI